MNSQKLTKTNNDTVLGLSYLIINLIISVAAQFLLKSGMAELGSFEMNGDVVSYLLNMLNLKIIGGLVFYASGIIFWLLCLSKLDLSFAYPAATFQYVLIFIGSWYIFHEQIGYERILGMLVISVGVIVISLDYRKV